jgi:transposase
MPTTRKRYAADFKAKVVLEALKGDQTLSQLARKHGIHKVMISAWRKKVINGLASVFSGPSKANGSVRHAEVEKLHAKIGQLVVERDVLAKTINGSASSLR